MTPQELEELHRLVRQAEAFAKRPLEEGETSRPITFFTHHLPDAGWRLGWQLVGVLRAAHPDLFRFYDEQNLHYEALGVLVGSSSAPSIDELADTLGSRGQSEEGSWLISVPIANASLDRPWAPAGPNAALRRTAGWQGPMTTEQEESAGVEHAEAQFGIYRHLHDRLTPTSRRLFLGDGHEVDTKLLVCMFLVEDGARGMATRQARAKAHYAIATWSILAPPDRWNLLPDLGSWSPQPSLKQSLEYKKLDPDQWISHERQQGGDYREWAPYTLPADDVLAAPFEAFAKLSRRPAQALLTATAALYAAGRGSRAQIADQVREARRSIECLCEPVAGGNTGNARDRWERLANRLDIWRHVAEARAYTPTQIAEVQARLINARNISAHGADAALLDLGWTAGDRPLMYGQLAAATDLSLAALSRDLEPMLFAIGEALRGTWTAMRAADFEESVFERLFAP